jgi:hypothetical protein
VTIVWRECDTFPTPAELERDPWFVIRLRTGKPPLTVGPEHGGGYMADAYFQAIQATSEQHHGDSGVLLGFVMAHELGHLLLGPGHTPDGVMQGKWGQKQWDALRQRWLRFTEEGAACSGGADGGERCRREIGAGCCGLQCAPRRHCNV